MLVGASAPGYEAAMKIGIIGGTGKEGRGLAVRWAKAGHDVVIGSRDAERGAAKAAELNEQFGITTLSGTDNVGACEGVEVVVLSVPYSGHRATLTALKPHLAGKIMVDITVPLQPPKVRQVNLPEGKAAALEANAILNPEGTEDADKVAVVATMHHVSSSHLIDLDHDIDCDVMVCGKKGARERIVELVGDLGMRGIDCGPLKNAVALESLTPVLLYINKKYGTPSSGVRITGIPE